MKIHPGLTCGNCANSYPHPHHKGALACNLVPLIEYLPDRGDGKPLTIHNVRSDWHGDCCDDWKEKSNG